MNSSPPFISLSPKENEILDRIQQLVREDDHQADYWAMLERFRSDNALFWFSCARFLTELPPSNALDLRPTGRLEAALLAVERLRQVDPGHLGVWSERLVALKYLTHGGQARSRALSLVMSGSPAYRDRAEELIAVAREACQRFPGDVWFEEALADALEDFGSD